MFFGDLKKEEFKQLNKNGIKNEFIKLLNELGSNDRVFVVAGELGFGCIDEVASAMIKAIQRGAMFEIFGGPYFLSDGTNRLNNYPNKILEYAGLTKPKNVNLYRVMDFKNASPFHFVISRESQTAIIEEPHFPSTIIKKGFIIKNSRRWCNRLLRYWEIMKKNYTKMNLEELENDGCNCKHTMKELTKSAKEMHPDFWKNRFGLSLESRIS